MNKWQQMTVELLEVMKPYSIAKRVCPIDQNKVKRWASGVSKPDADEGPELEKLYASHIAEKEVLKHVSCETIRDVITLYTHDVYTNK